MLPTDEWLRIAQRLAVGQKERVYHLRERRPNLVVGHSAGKYWAYCQACKEGGVVDKAHVKFTGNPAPAESTTLTLPPDMVPVRGSIHEGPVWRFVVSKGLDPNLLPGAMFSPSRMRLMLKFDEGWMGRDVTERSPQKWMTYSGQHYLLLPGSLPGTRAVVLEDAFSAIKVHHALQQATMWADVVCSLGTRIHPSLLIHLADYRRVVVMYDGDAAGRSGADKGRMSLRGLGVSALVKCAPDGLDPKDMDLEDIVAHLKEVL